MKLTTTTLIVIAEIKWTLQTSHPCQDLNGANRDGMIQVHASRPSVIVPNPNWNYCQSKEDNENSMTAPPSEQKRAMKKQHFYGKSSKLRLEEQQISKKLKVNEEFSSLPIEQTTKENTTEGRTGVLAKKNSSTEERTVSQQESSVIAQPTTTKDNAMECAESSQEIESSQKRNLENPLEDSIEKPRKKRAKMNDGSILYIADIQSKPEKSVNTSLDSTNSNKNSENIWSWIKNQVTQGKNTYTDFCIPQIYKEILKSKNLTGYYNGFADDFKDYIEEHRPRTEAEKKKQEAENECIYKYTLGDIYMKQELNSDAIEKCKTSSEEQSDHKLLENKAQIIFNIPEIYQDLKQCHLNFSKRYY